MYLMHELLMWTFRFGASEDVNGALAQGAMFQVKDHGPILGTIGLELELIIRSG